MPDIKTALTTALNEWEQQAEDANKLGAARASSAVNPSTSGGTVIEPAPRNMTRDTFAMVRDNPNITRVAAVQRLETMGHKPTSTTSILSQMVRAKMVDEVDGVLSTKRKHYTSLTHALEKAPKGRRKARVQKPKVIETAPKPQATHAWVAPEPQAAPVKTARKLMEEDRQRVSNEIDEWLNGVTLRYASLVYERLHYIFGAKK
jgi:hypothetical protein